MMVTIPVSYNPSAFALMLRESIAAPNTRSTRTSGAPAQNTPATPTNGLSGSISLALATICGIVTTGGTLVTAASKSASPAGSGTQTAAGITSITLSGDRSLRDLCNMEAVLTGNTKGVVRPSVGSSKVVDALMKLAKGSDVALAVAAREILPKIVSAKDGPDGQSVVTYRSDPALEAFKPANLPEAAVAMSTEVWSNRTILNIASSMASGQKLDPFEVNFLRAKMFGSFTLTETTTTSTNGDTNKEDADLNRNFGGGASGGQPFNWRVALNPGGTGTQPLTSFSATAVYARYNAF
jgi:hypothetical protein